MARISKVIQSVTDCYEHPIDKIAGAVLALAVYDAAARRRKTNRNNSNYIRLMTNRRMAARRWLRYDGIYWLEALDMEPGCILEAISGD